MTTPRYHITPTKEEIKKKIFNVWLEVTPTGIFRCHDSDSFEVDGLKPDAEPPPVKRPCTLRPFWMHAESDPMDDAAENGVVFKVKMRDGRIVDRFVSGAQLENPRIFETLRALGVRVRMEPFLRSAIRQYITNNDAPEVVRTYGRSGWTNGPSGRAFVLGSEVVGDDAGRFESTANPPTACRSHGTLKSWLETVATPAHESPIWSFAVCAAFAAPLMDLVNFTGEGGWHFYGNTSIGKTLCLEAAASVYGPPQSVDGSRYIQTWNVTGGAIEMIAETFNGLLICLDELGEASAKAVTQAVYALSDGQGRKRLTREGRAQRVRSWRVLTMSSGEVSIEDKITNGGHTLRGGQALRIADIWAEHDDLNRVIPEAAQALKASVMGSYGVVGSIWLKHLVELANEKPEELNELRAEFAHICAVVSADIKDARRVRASQRFALVRVAAELAQSLGLLPACYNVRDIVNTVFGVWSTDTAAVTLNEDQQAARRLLDFIDEQTGATLQQVDQHNGLVGEIRQNRAGWIRESIARNDEQSPQRVFLLKKALDSAIGEYNLRAFCRSMRAAGCLHTGKQPTKSYTYPTPRFEGRYQDYKNLPRTYQLDVCSLRAFIGEENEPINNQQPEVKGADEWISNLSQATQPRS